MKFTASRLRRSAAAALMTATIVAVPLATTPISSPTPAYACQKAKIGGKSKCIAAGQFCAKRYERDYNRYGYTCNKQDARGNWHLEDN